MPTKSNLSLLDGYAQTKEMPEHERNLVWLSAFLEPDERALVMAVLGDGQPIKLAAKLMGEPYMAVRSRVNCTGSA
jgi:DNA-directed RNA polymerase specialized sigma24 family protein